MNTPSKPIIYFWLSLHALMTVLLSIFINKVSELIRLPPISIVACLICSLIATLSINIKLIRSQESSGDIDRSKTQTRKRLVKPSSERLLAVIICGASALAGGYTWFGFGILGLYYGYPIMFLVVSLILKFTPISQSQLLRDTLICGSGLGALGSCFMFLAALVIIEQRGGLNVDGVPVFPMMRTFGGLIIMVIIGCAGAITGAFFPVEARRNRFYLTG
jgi:hypothetical protein